MQESKITSDWFELPLTKDNDAKILKKIKRPGQIIDDPTCKKTDDELRPRLGDCVKIKLIGKTEKDLNLFLNKVDEPIEFNLFTGEMIKGLDLVISTMLKGELADASISPEYVNEDLFNEFRDQIPRDKQLLFTIELLDWENEYLSRKNDGGIIRKVLRKGIGYETPIYNSTITININGFIQLTPQDTNLINFDNRTNLKFRLSEGCEVGLVKGLESGCYKMKTNEKNRLFILNKYGLNEDILNNFKPIIPLNQLPSKYYRIIYEIEMCSFDNIKQIWELTVDERFQFADIEKERGTEFFKQNKLYLSLKCYSDVLKFIGPPELQLDNNLAEIKDDNQMNRIDFTDDQKIKRTELILTCYNNMSLCYLKLKMPKEAFKYTEWALAIDPNNLKALYRKGLSYYDRNEFTQSIELFERCLEIDPTNKSAKNQIQLAQKQIERYANKEKQIFSQLFQALAKEDEI